MKEIIVFLFLATILAAVCMVECVKELKEMYEEEQRKNKDEED